MKLGNLPKTPNNSCKISYITGAIAAFLIFEFYTAMLTSYITISDSPRQIRQIDDILTMGYDLVTWKDTALDARFIEV